MKSKDEKELDADEIKDIGIDEDDVKKVTSICTKLSPDELKCILSLSSDKIFDIIGDLIFNCVFNDAIYPKIKKCRKYKKVKKEIDNNKDKILDILDSRCTRRRTQMIQKQIGSGMISLLAKLLISALPIFSSVTNQRRRSERIASKKK